MRHTFYFGRQSPRQEGPRRYLGIGLLQIANQKLARAIGNPKVVLRVSHNLSIRRVIDRLDPGDLWLQRVLVLLHVPKKLKLGGRGAYDEDRLVPIERASHVGEEAVRIIRMAMPVGWTLQVAAHALVWRSNGRFVEFATLDAKDPRLMVIEPDCGGMGTHSGATFLLPKFAA
jgi:hypothetical protein